MKHIGRVVKGHVLDTSPKYVERRLQHYDPLLYLTWNTEKRMGRGIWEVRRRPASKIGVFKGLWADGTPVFQLEYREDPMIHHVLDVRILTDDVFRKIHSMDTFRQHKWVDQLDYEQERSQIHLENKNREELSYQLRHHKKELATLREAAASGINPAHFFAINGKR